MTEFQTSTVWWPDDRGTPTDVMDEIKDLWTYYGLGSDACWPYSTDDNDMKERLKINEYLKRKGIVSCMIMSYW